MKNKSGRCWTTNSPGKQRFIQVQ